MQVKNNSVVRGEKEKDGKDVDGKRKDKKKSASGGPNVKKRKH